MKESRRSFLQIKILLELEKEPAKTVVALTGNVNAQRPSVSRSLKILKTQGLVFRNQRGWQLTEAGKTELSVIKKKYAESATRIHTATLRTNAAFQEIAESVGNITRNFTQQIAAQSNLLSIAKAFKYPDLIAFTNLNTNHINLIKEINKTANAFISKEFTENAIKPLLAIQERNNAVLQELITPQISSVALFTKSILNQNSLNIANTIHELVAAQQDLITKTMADTVKVDFSWLAKDLSQVVAAFTPIISAQLLDWEASRFVPPSVQFAERLVLPGVTVASYVDSAHSFIDAETEPEPPMLSPAGLTWEGDRKLDELLAQLNPDFVEIRHGSWFALQSAGPDRLRHAASSMRELIRQLLELLVPDKKLPKEDRGKPQLKLRLILALQDSDRDSEFVVSVGQALVSSYDQLNKYAHHNEKHEDTLRSLLLSTEGWIGFILSLRNKEVNQ
jgi:predicted transcriptional regulator